MDRRIVVVDVGCRWGFADEFVECDDVFDVYGFDPDEKECARLSEEYGSSHVSLIPLALSSSVGEQTLYLTQQPACSSLYKPDSFLTSNYSAFHCEVEVGQTIVKTTTLDEWRSSVGLKYVDHLKIDTQGSELDVLKGAVRTLGSVRSIQVEVEFNPMYLEQPLFHDVDAYLRQHGFVLWRLSEITHYSRNKTPGDAIGVCDIRFDDWHSAGINVYAGQLFWANAHYVSKKVLEGKRSVEEQERDRVLFPAIGMPDVLGAQGEWDSFVQERLRRHSVKASLLGASRRETAESLDFASGRADVAEQRAVEAEQRAVEAEQRAVEAEQRAVEAEQRAVEAEQRAVEALAECRTQLAALVNSRSWLITAPLRAICKKLR